MATQKQVFTEAHENIDKANHTTSGLIEYLRYIFGKLENASGGGGGGSEVSWTQIQATGTKIAEIEIDGDKTSVYAPTVEANNLGPTVNLTPYDSDSNKYTFPSDGYVMISISANTGVERYGSVIINGNDNANSPLYLTCYANNTNINQRNCLFVRKGMKCYCSFSDSINVSGTFYPLH